MAWLINWWTRLTDTQTDAHPTLKWSNCIAFRRPNRAEKAKVISQNQTIKEQNASFHRLSTAKVPLVFTLVIKPAQGLIRARSLKATLNPRRVKLRSRNIAFSTGTYSRPVDKIVTSASLRQLHFSTQLIYIHTPNPETSILPVPI